MRIKNSISIEDKYIKEDFILSSGPGGQNVNKVATAVQLRFDVKNCTNLKDRIRSRLYTVAGSKITEEGILIIEARRYRTREQNRKDAYNRLSVLLKKATEKKKKRLKTKPSKGSIERRLKHKKKHASQKRLRNKNISQDE